MKYFVKYSEYITSKEWRDKHKEFLKQAGYRCAFSGLKIGRGRRYNIHHMDYDCLGEEVYRKNVVAVHPWFHKFILHGILSGFKRPSQQVFYPNTPQKIAHGWCLLPGSCKLITLFTVAGLVGYGSASMYRFLSPSVKSQTAIWATSTQFLVRSANHAKR